ncbi:MAG: efflux transporter, family, subunit [Bacteroidetes bacterium]|jgi:RND family efflux transporter MFP subunit|nr:efflux transporter, family, subunit [Bacteroidota bacterium]
MDTKMSSGRRIALAGAILVVVLIIVIGITSRNGKADNTQLTVPRVAVEVRPAATSTITETVSAVGTITAMRDVVVSSETAGRVTKVAIKVGDAVKVGQPLVIVDDELKAIAVEQARAQLLAAETNHNKARKDFQRAETLFKTGDIADVELEGNRLALHSSEAQFKSAQVGLKLAQRQFEDTRIKAPISGIIASKRVEVGEMVAPGREVANIVDLSNVKVKLSIQEEEIGKIRLNQPVALRVDPAPYRTFEGTIYTIGFKTESPTGHSYPVEVVVRNRDLNVLKVGMFARVDIRTNAAENVITISKESLVSSEASPAVFVVEDGVARLRTVRLGIRSGDSFQVLDGLKTGDLVVSFGQKNLKDGALVQYK